MTEADFGSEGVEGVLTRVLIALVTDGVLWELLAMAGRTSSSLESDSYEYKWELIR